MSKRSGDFDATMQQKRSRLSDDFSASGDLMFRRASFGAHSPTGSLRGLSSAEVAADFKEALQDLSTNDRIQITNLTIIAKESTEYAESISKVLEEHIRTCSPSRKLPALYVLDSIVKNVGTPFTLYLARNLFKTFMDAYTLVDQNTRKSMEAMLSTWKQPIPGSMEHRPVFPLEVVKPIDTTLLKVRTIALQHQQAARSQTPSMHALPPRPVAMTPQPDWARIGTPPQSHPMYPQPQQHVDPRYRVPSALPQQQSPYAVPPSPYLQMQQPHMQQPHTQQPQTPVYGAYAPPPQPTPMQPPPSNPLDLAALLRGASFPPAPQQQYQNPMAPPPPPPFQAQNPPQPPPVMFPGLEALFKLPGFQQAAPQMQQYQALARVMPPQVYQPPPMIPNLAQALTQAQTSAPTPSQSFASLNGLMANPSNDVQLTSASLKLPRPHLLRSLYNHVPSQCLTCGRRFAADAEGKSRKARHLDAHFRTNTRLADAQRRGVSRSWFLDELDWIRSREIDDADEDIDTATKGDGNAGVDAASKVVADAGSDLNRGGTGGQTAGIKEYYVKAPADAAVAHHACPICQEEFKTVWHDGAQEWVWMDATIQGEKTYHASCVLEMARDGNQGGVKREY